MFGNFKKNESPVQIDEDILYEFVLDEMQFGKPRKGLLTKAVLESDGDDDKAKSLYLKYRVEAIEQDIQDLQLDPKRFSKEELFHLMETDFAGYKKSAREVKILFKVFVLLLVIALFIAIYLFLPQSLFEQTNKQEVLKPMNDGAKAVIEKKQIQRKKLDGIRDKYGNLYKEIKSPYTKRVWLDRNLGAKKVCDKYDEEQCFGDYFQWGRGADGHEKASSDITTKISGSELVEHDKFILGTSENRYDWLKFQNNNLWQGHYGENNPCPQGFRLPTAGEFKAELIDHGGTNKYKIYKSFLKLPMAGFRNYEGLVNNQGFEARYWASSRKSQFSLALSSSNSGERPYIFFFERSNGHTLRCIKDLK